MSIAHNTLRLSSIPCTLWTRRASTTGVSLKIGANIGKHFSTNSNRSTLTKTLPKLLYKQDTILSRPIRSLHTQSLRPYVDPRLSYAFGRSNEYLRYTTVNREFINKLRDTPDEIIYEFPEESLSVTYRQLDTDVNKLLKTFVLEFNLQKCDPIGVFAYNCYNWVVAQYACARLGAILTPINPSYKSNELAYVLKKGKVKCLLMPGPKSVQAELNDHMSVLQSAEVRGLDKTNDYHLRNVLLMDSNHDYHSQIDLPNCELHDWSICEKNDARVFQSIEEAKDAGQADAPDLCIVDPDSVSPDDIFAIYYTSGTTGNPKGACISHFTTMNNVYMCQNRIRHGKTRRMVVTNTLPMFHIFAGVLTALSPLLSNTVVVFSGHKYDTKTYVKTIIDYNTSLITVTPTILIDMLSYVERKGLGSKVPLNTVQSGGAALMPEVASKTFKVLPQLEELILGYGSTENGAVATLQTVYEPAETRASTVGPPLDFSEVRIVKPNTDDLVAHNVNGEIQTRGYNTMMGYLDDKEKTDEVITPNRWYRTGDIGYMLPHGSIQISARMKHMIIRGGENIYPEEVEQLIHTLPYVEVAHIVGVPDKRYGEQVCAWIKLKQGYSEAEDESSERKENTVHKNDVIEYCRKNITYFKVPKYILFVEDFPMTPTKKVQKHLMTETSIKLLGL